MSNVKGRRNPLFASDSYRGVETMSMRRGVVVTVGLVGAVLQAFLTTGAARGEDTEPASFLQEAEFVEAAKVAEDQFGAAVAIEGDMALIGAPGADSKGSSSGAVQVFHRNEEGVWQATQTLTASNGEAGDFFGASVVLSEESALIGARGANPKGSFSGAVYVFARGSDGVWREAAILSADDGKAGDFFGWSMAVDGDTALIGARGNGDSSSFPGAAYVFVRGESGWAQTQKLTAADGVGGDEFGYSVAVLGDTALIGARGKNEMGLLMTGAAYLFARDAAGQWTQQQKLIAGDGMTGDEFGYSAALAENMAFVGARFAVEEDPEDLATAAHPGAVYVYELKTEPEGAVWEETQKLFASEGVNGDEFGGSLAASGDTLLIGARNESAARGAVYFFTRTREDEIPSPWEEQQEILARDGASGDTFGSSIALRGDVAIMGSPFDDVIVEDTNGDGNADDATTYPNSGSAHIFAMTSLPAECTVKTDYDDAQCKNVFTVSSLEELDDYVATDFGRADNDGRYAGLDIIANLTSSVLVLQSPCEITFDPGITLSGDFINIDGRKGISGRRTRIQAEKVCIVSEQGNVSPGDDAIIEVGELTLQAGGRAIIGDDATVTVDGVLTIEAVGEEESSEAVIDSGALVGAGSVQIKSPHAAEIREESRLTVDGALSLVSTQDGSGSEAVVGEKVQIQATDLTVSSPRKAEIDNGASIELSGNGEVVSGNKTVVNKNAVINVTGNLRLEAADAGQCEISGSAQISAGTQSGNCF